MHQIETPALSSGGRLIIADSCSTSSHAAQDRFLYRWNAKRRHYCADGYLRQSPRVQMARRKEVHFFDNETLDWSAPDYASLHSEFDGPVPVPVAR